MFWENFRKLCFALETTPTRVCADLDIALSAPNKWKKGSIPNKTTLAKLAQYFGVTVEYFFISQENQPVTSSNMNDYLEQLRNRPEIRTLFSLTKNASREDVERAVAIIKALKETNNG